MIEFKFVNALIQSLIIVLLLYNAIVHNTLSLYELIFTLIAVAYNLFTEFIDDE